MTTDFRVFLRLELARRCARNPGYSLRAFARHLAVDHSTLSQWLRGRRALSTRMIERLGTQLRLPARRLRVFVDRRCTDGPEFAILDLARDAAFRPDSRWIARELGITVDETNAALQRLLRLDLLRMASPGRWVTQESQEWDAR